MGGKGGVVECFGTTGERADLRGCYYGDQEHVIPCSRSLEDLGESKELGAFWEPPCLVSETVTRHG